MRDFESFIDHSEGKQRDLYLFLHHFFTVKIGMSCKLRFKIPFYDHKSWVCYVNPIKKKGVELVFLQGKKLSNVQGVLDARGRKQVAGIYLNEISEIDESILYEIVQEALLIDEALFQKLKHSKKR